MSKCRNCGAAMAAEDRFCGECGADQKAGLEAMMTLGGLETLSDGQTRGGASREPMPELPAGAEFAGRYVIRSVIGKGGMGVVYRAEDNLVGKDVALKLIRPDRLSGPESVRRLISEGVTARDIRHTNIVAVYDVGEADGQPFVSMEYLKGQSLRDWHREKIRQREDIPLRVAARIVAEVLDGLSAAHAAGVIHRDLKPENIMLVGEPGEAAAPLKILDFGIARAAGAGLESGTGTGIGTPRYMAPEQVTNPDTAGPPADLYSLSIIFYELLVDVLPQGHWQPPSGGRADVPAGIDRLIERGLANRPANRPQTAAEYRKALVDAVNLAVTPRTSRVLPIPANDTESVTFDRKALLKWGGIGMGVLLVLGIVGAALDGDDSGSTGPAYNGASGYSSTPTPDDFSSRIGTQTQASVSSLSGYWMDDQGQRYTMRVGNDGAFSGSGTNAYGFPVQFSGRINGAAGSFTVTMPTAGMSFNGRLQWDRGCHIDYQVFDQMNAVTDQGRFHVNHSPGAPCPS